MRKQYLLFLIVHFIFGGVAAQDAFDGAQWIGAIGRDQANIPEGRYHNETKLKDPAVKAAWAAVDTLSRKSIILRRSFKPQKTVKQAEVRICGLGFYELTINDQKVGDAEFAPLWSDYDKTVFYNTYDVTRLLNRQDNELRVLLGNGVYNEQGGRYHKMKISFGPPTLRFLLSVTYADNTTERLVSDSQWQWTFSPLTFNSLYGGEDYDARMESVASKAESWKKVVVQQGPKGKLMAQIAHPVKIMERFPVKQTLKQQGDTLLLLDMGQNLSGYPEITVQGRAGQHLKLTPGETLNDQGLVNQKQTGRPHYYTYILKGSQTAETWHPRFSYYGYRYLQIEGDVEVLKKVESCFVYNSAARTGSFECSNQLINDTHRLIDRAIRSNWQAVWTDCPHREKLGWLEQDWLNGEGLVYNYDCQTMLQQTMQNIVDAQHDDGSMPEIAPEYTRFSGPWAKPFLESPEWGGAIVALPMLYWRHYGSLDLARKHYDAMKRYVDYLSTQDSCYILKQGLGDWYDYGPGRAGFAKNTPMPLVSTAHYYQWVSHLSVMASQLGNQQDADQLQTRADFIREAFNREFYDSTKKSYATGSQCSLALPLYMNLVPKGDEQAVLQHLIDDIHQHGDRLTTGDVGNRYLFYVLVQNGQRELLYKMLNHYDVPGYGYQIKLGHTTLTEQWDPTHGASMNHFMMGHVENLLIPDLLGIQRRGDQIEIAPHPVGDLTWCKGATESAHGQVRVSWMIEGDTFTIDVEIPEHQAATLRMPYSGREQQLAPGRHTVEEKLMTTKH